MSNVAIPEASVRAVANELRVQGAYSVRRTVTPDKAVPDTAAFTFS